MYMETIRVGSKVVMIKELTVGDVRAWLKRAIDLPPKPDPVDFLILEGISLQDLQMVTNIKNIDDYTPSELEEVLEACRRVNKHFFILRDRVLNPIPQTQTI